MKLTLKHDRVFKKHLQWQYCCYYEKSGLNEKLALTLFPYKSFILARYWHKICDAYIYLMPSPMHCTSHLFQIWDKPKLTNTKSCTVQRFWPSLRISWYYCKLKVSNFEDVRTIFFFLPSIMQNRSATSMKDQCGLTCGVMSHSQWEWEKI